jgi:hypothetical protein
MEVAMPHRIRCLVPLVLALLAVTAPAASELGARLDRELKGGWGVLDLEVYSSCGGTYSNNEVSAAGVASKAAHRFDAGELVKIDDVTVKRQRVDLLLSLAAPLLVAYADGPFELYDQRLCRVQLMVYVPRELIKNADVEALLSSIREHLSLFASYDEARLSDAWNGRETEPFPGDYDDTLLRHAVWQAEQTNAAVSDGIDRALAAAADAANDLENDDDYLAGFATGAEKMSDFALSDCGSLLRASQSTYGKRAPADQSKRWQNGWDDGQRLIFNILLAERLRGCTVPVPITPPP